MACGLGDTAPAVGSAAGLHDDGRVVVGLRQVAMEFRSV